MAYLHPVLNPSRWDLEEIWTPYYIQRDFVRWSPDILKETTARDPCTCGVLIANVFATHVHKGQTPKGFCWSACSRGDGENLHLDEAAMTVWVKQIWFNFCQSNERLAYGRFWLITSSPFSIPTNKNHGSQFLEEIIPFSKCLITIVSLTVVISPSNMGSHGFS